MNTLTTTSTAASAVILPDDLDSKLKTDGKRAVASRLKLYGAWLDSNQLYWTEPALADYRDAMIAQGKAPSTVNAHLSTIRSRYSDMLKEKARIAELDTIAAEYCRQNGFEQNPANIEATVSRLRFTIQNALDCQSAKEIEVQDHDASEFLRLTTQQANALLCAPGIHTLAGLRDTALIALALATGARAAELAALQVGDHAARNESGALCLRIRDGKGGKQRLVPYGALEFAPALVNAWLKQSGITDGAIFRGFYKGNKKYRKSAITTVAIEQLLQNYPVTIDGEFRAVKPHDLRRTYARLAYESGMKPVAIQQNLGHADLSTTLLYIGQLDSAARQPSAFIHFDTSGL